MPLVVRRPLSVNNIVILNFQGVKNLSLRIKCYLDYSFFIIQIFIAIALLISDKVYFEYDVVGVSVLYLIYIYLESKFKLYISNYIRSIVILTLIIHTFMGKLLNYYQTVPAFDVVLHIFGTYSIVLFAYAIMNKALGINFSTRLNKFIFLMLLGGCLGAIYEIIEFLLDLTLKPPIPYQAGLIDTDLDIISDIIGSFIASFHVCLIGLHLRFFKP